MCDYKLYKDLKAYAALAAVAVLMGCGSSANVASPTNNSSSNNNQNNSVTYMQSSSPASGTYSNIPTAIILTFSAPMSSSVLSTSNWSFYCGSNLGVNSVTGSGIIYTVNVPSVTPTNNTTCQLTSSGLTDQSGNSVSASVAYTYSSSANNTGGGTTAPAYTFDFSNQGPQGKFTATQIDTDNLLQVTVTLGQPTTIPGTGYTAEYSCAQFMVTVLGQSQTVFLSNTGSPGYGYCNGAQTSQMVDFSSRLTTGHGPVSVTVTNVSYDNCRLYGDVYGYGCPMTAVYSTHILTGALSIVVNTP